MCVCVWVCVCVSACVNLKQECLSDYVSVVHVCRSNAYRFTYMYPLNTCHILPKLLLSCLVSL